MSLKQIAQELGLSLTTVSRALNGYPEVALATREAVKAAADRLQYQPDARARSLALGRADAVGMVFPITPGDLGDLLFLEVASAMSERFAQEGVDLLIISAAENDELAAYKRAISSRRVAAFVVARTLVQDARLNLLHARQMPFVAYGRSREFAHPYPWVDFDNQAGGRMATERLIELGHRRIAYLGAAPTYNFADLRYAGFHGAMMAAGLSVEYRYVHRAALNRRAGFAAMQALMAQPEPPTAILVDNHIAGAGAVHAALQSGYVLGQNLSMIVYDGMGPDSVVRTPITSVDHPTTRSTGLALAEMTLARINGVEVESLHQTGDPVLVRRGSDGPPPVDT